MGSSSDAARIHAAVELVAAAGARCVFCGRAAELVGTFVPTDPGYRLLIGAPAGKARCLVYPLCEGCADDEWYREPEGERAIIRAFAADLAAGTGEVPS